MFQLISPFILPSAVLISIKGCTIHFSNVNINKRGEIIMAAGLDPSLCKNTKGSSFSSGPIKY